MFQIIQDCVESVKPSFPDLLAYVSPLAATPEVRVDCPDDVKFEVVQKITDSFKGQHEVVDIDGARVLFDDGWGLIRASNTQPALVLRAKAKTPDALERIKRTIEQELSRTPRPLSQQLPSPLLGGEGGGEGRRSESKGRSRSLDESLITHWEQEIRAFEEAIRRTKERLGRRRPETPGLTERQVDEILGELSALVVHLHGHTRGLDEVVDRDRAADTR